MSKSKKTYDPDFRLSERLKITEEQKTEITHRLFSFLKKVNEEKKVKDIPSHILINWYLRFIEKPEWIAKKLTDVSFVAGLCDFMDRYKNNIGLTKYVMKYEPVIMEGSLVFQPDRETAKNFLENMAKTLGREDVFAENMSTKELKKGIYECFYPDGELSVMQ